MIPRERRGHRGYPSVHYAGSHVKGIPLPGQEYLKAAMNLQNPAHRGSRKDAGAEALFKRAAEC